MKKKAAKKISICFFLLFVVNVSFAQNKTMYFEQINAANGLSNNKVNCILQDKRGFIWIGTNDGLNRYDGANFTIFRSRPFDNTTISGNIITDLLEDEDGRIWIATADGGISKYNYRLPPQEQFTQYKHQPSNIASLPVNVVNCLLLDKYGNIWMGTSGAGVLELNTKTNQFILPLESKSSTCLDLCMDASGNIWAARQGGGYCIINKETKQYEIDKRYTDMYAQLPHMAATSLLPDGPNIWLGSWDKAVYSISTSTKAETKYKSNGFNEDEITCFAKDSKGNIWMGGKAKGLQYFDKASQQFHSYQHDASKEGSLASNHINCVYTTRDGILWIGTDKGISKSNPQKNKFVQQFLSVAAQQQLTIYDFYKMKNELWIGTSNGIYIQTNDGKISHLPLVYNQVPLQVTKFYYHQQSNTFYIGTNYSLFKMNIVTKQLSLLPNTDKDVVMKRLIESRIIAIEQDTMNGRPVLMVLPYGHFMAWYDFDLKKWVSRKDSISKIVERFGFKDHLIRKLYKDGQNKLWLATNKNGLAFWEQPLVSRLKHFDNNPYNATSISNNNVFDFAADDKDNFWVSTYGGGLHYFNKASNKFSHVQSSSNLSEGIAVDAKSNVWTIANGNLYKYNPSTQTTSSFNLPDIEKSGGIHGSMFKNKNGLMYVAGNNYFIAFHPDSLKENNKEPELFFTDFKIFNISYSHLLQEKEINFSYKENYFSIEFAAPEFNAIESVTYSCMLEGVDKDWVQLGSKNNYNYNNLPAGSFVFKVKASNKSGNWGNKTSILYITVAPPFWRTWWFILLTIVFLVMLVWLMYRYRINEMVKRQAIRNKIAQDLHDNVGSTLSSIAVYSQVAQIQHSKGNDDKLADVLGKIASTSNETITEMNDIVWAINPANDDVEKIIQRMESFAKPLMAAKEIQLQTTCTDAAKKAHLSMEKRKNFYLIFKEAINNVVKYAACSQCKILVDIKGNKMILMVEDNGIGFNIQNSNNLQEAFSISGTGNGLKNMQQRAKEMKGSLQIISSEGAGTTIHLQFPIP